MAKSLSINILTGVPQVSLHKNRYHD